MKSFTLLICAFCFGSQLIAQVGQDTTAPAAAQGDLETISLVDYLPPLSILIDSAIANSPDVDILEYEMMNREYQKGALRKDWADLVTLGAQYRYTDFDRLVFDDVGDPIARQARGYQLSAGVRLPLSYLIGRKEALRSADMEIKQAASRMQGQRNTVKERVIDTYNHLLLLQRLLKITIDAKESSELILEMAEDRFRDGEISLEELASSTSLRANYASKHEELKADFYTTYAQLERLVGIPLVKLQNLNE